MGAAEAKHVVSFPVPDVEARLSDVCDTSWFTDDCRADLAFEDSLERQYWALVQNSDVAGMEHWLDKTDTYLAEVDAHHEPQLTILLAFGYLMCSRAQGIARGLPDLGRAIHAGRRAEQLDPTSFSIRPLNRYLDIALDLAMGNRANAEQTLLQLRRLHEEHGATAIEAEVVAQYAMLGSTEPDLVQQALDTLRETPALVLQTTSLAPFKPVGTYLAMAEGQAFLGDRASAELLIHDARVWGQDNGLPPTFLNRIDEARDTLLLPDGLADQWEAGATPIGLIRMPLGPSQSAESCALCHLGHHDPRSTTTR